MSRVVSWKVFVIVALSAFGALAPLKKWAYSEVGLWNGDRTRLLLYLMLAGMGVAFGRNRPRALPMTWDSLEIRHAGARIGPSFQDMVREYY